MNGYNAGTKLRTGPQNNERKQVRNKYLVEDIA
jgi:hypothetical protein